MEGPLSHPTRPETTMRVTRRICSGKISRPSSATKLAECALTDLSPCPSSGPLPLLPRPSLPSQAHGCLVSPHGLPSQHAPTLPFFSCFHGGLGRKQKVVLGEDKSRKNVVSSNPGVMTPNILSVLSMGKGLAGSLRPHPLSGERRGTCRLKSTPWASVSLFIKWGYP